MLTGGTIWAPNNNGADPTVLLCALGGCIWNTNGFLMIIRCV